MPRKKAESGRKRGVITAKGAGVWMVRVFVGVKTENGRPKRIYTAKTVRGTYKQADQARVGMLSELDSGSFVAPTKQTLSDYLDHWLTNSASLSVSPRTLTMYRYLMENYVCPVIGSKKLADLHPADVQALIHSMREKKKLGRRMLQYTHTVLKSALQQAVDWRQLPNNPAHGIKLPPKPANSDVRKILEAEHIQKIVEATADTDLGAFWVLMLNTGMRPGECAALTWADVQGGRLTINKALVETRPGHYEVGPTKNASSNRTITLPKGAISALSTHRIRQAERILKSGAEYTRNDLIFATRSGGLLCLHNVYRAWKAMLKAQKLPHVSLYNCRHTHISLLLASGVPIKAVSERAGHASAKMTLDIYQSVLPETESAAASMFDTLLQKTAANA